MLGSTPMRCERYEGPQGSCFDQPRRRSMDDRGGGEVGAKTRGSRAANRLRYAAFVLFLALFASVLTTFPAFAAQVQHLNTQTATATGAGATGTPTITGFNIPSGKNRVLFIWASFERDHCSPTDASNSRCVNANTAGTGLGDNWPEPRTGTPPATTSNNQITAQVTGPGGTINKQNALLIGGTPSGDTRFITISNSPQGSPSGTAYFSLSSFHIALFENEINTLLGGAASGTVSISLPSVVAPSNAGDDAILIVSAFQNVEQTPAGFVRNATGSVQSASSVEPAGNYTITPTAYDAGQAPNEADDGKLVMGFNATIAGFLTPAGHAVLATPSTINANGTWDTPLGNLNNEPNGSSSGAYFRNGGATPGSSYTLQSAGTATPAVYGGTNASFLLESDNADIADAPISYGNPTHTITGIRLGATADADAALLNSANATGDDTNNTDDEDGITLSPLLPTGETTIVPVSIQNGSGFLNAWFDWNADGDFADAGEQMVTNQAVATSTVNLNIAVPATAIIGPTFARFRVCTNNTALDLCSTPAGTVQSGEVEDYQFTVSRKLILRKTTLGGAGGPFGFALTNTVQTTGTVTTTATNTPTSVDGDTASTATVAYSIVSPTTDVTINENSLPAGWSLTGATCVNAAIATVGSLSGSTYTITGAEIAASTSFTCTFTNTRLARLTLTKLAVGGGATFPFTVTGGLTPASFNLNPNPPSTPSVSQVFTNVVPGTNIVITENAPSTPNWVLAAINCTDASGAAVGSTVTTNITNGPATKGTATVNLVPGADLNCTFVNTRNVDIAIVKNAVGGDTAVNYTITNSGGGTIATPSLTTVGGTGVANAGVTVPNTGNVTFNVIESVPAGYQLTNISCSASSGTLTVNSTNLAAGTVNLTATAGTQAACTYTNVRRPTITIRKLSVGGTQNFGFGTGINGLPAILNLDTTLSNPQSSAPFTVVNITQSASLTEAVPAGWTLNGWQCTDPLANIVASGTTPTLTIPATVIDDGNNLVCTFTNSKQPVLRLQKLLPNGRYVAADQFTLSIAGIGGPATVTTTGSGATATGTAALNPATAGASYTFTETGASGANLANYVVGYACTNTFAGGQTPSGLGTSFSLVPAIGDDLTCSFVNVRNLIADLSLTKTNTPGAGASDQPGDTVTSGTTIAYTLVVGNAGPDAADGTVLADPPPDGAVCTTATCTAAGGATCPVATGAALVAELQGAGTIIPLLPATGAVTIVVDCDID
jgi:GEVED domain/Domain of unknown function DUF11